MSGGDHRWFKRSTGQKRPVTRDIHPYRIIIIIVIIEAKYIFPNDMTAIASFLRYMFPKCILITPHCIIYRVAQKNIYIFYSSISLE